MRVMQRAFVTLQESQPGATSGSQGYIRTVMRPLSRQGGQKALM